MRSFAMNSPMKHDENMQKEPGTELRRDFILNGYTNLLYIIYSYGCNFDV